MMNARPLDFDDVPWATLDGFSDRTVFQTRPWLAFLAETQGALPIVAELRDGGDVGGYFTGLIVRRFGVRILGSSFPGWTTPYMGFNLVPGASRRDALGAIERLAFGELKCLHLEVSDRGFVVEDGRSLGFEHRFYESYETDLRQTEAQIFGTMNSACRRCVRKADKSGVVVTIADEPGFADEYYRQLQDVFAKQQLVPTYGPERVRALVKHLLPTGHLLIARAMSPSGECLGTGIYPAANRVAEFWGNASYRSAQSLRPNEALHWFAMRYWKARGIEAFDWGGGGTYKEKYGPVPIAIPWFFKSRYKVLSVMRDQARRVVRLRQELLGRMKAAPVQETAGVGEDD
jgi:Acetyltransferase (GNAT) domain